MTVIKGSGIKSKRLYICFPQTDKRSFLMLDWWSIFQSFSHLLSQNHQYTNHNAGDGKSKAIEEENKGKETKSENKQIISDYLQNSLSQHH